MGTVQRQANRTVCWPVAFQTGLDEAVEFHIPEHHAPHYFFPLDKQAEGTDPPIDLLVVVDDFVTGETEYQIDFDEAVDRLLQTFATQPPVTLEEKFEDIGALKALAGRFQSVATRLLREAGRREEEFQELDESEMMPAFQVSACCLGISV